MIKETVLKQYDRCYNENGWFVAVRNAVEGVMAEQAAWKPEGSDNSIWESLAHITYYNNAYLQRFKGIEFEYDVADNDETFRGGDPTEGAWRSVVEKFDSVMSEWRADRTIRRRQILRTRSHQTGTNLGRPPNRRQRP